MSEQPDLTRRAFFDGSILSRRKRHKLSGKPQKPDLKVDELKCLTWNGVYCISCLSPCSEHALKLDSNQRLLVNEKCTGCGECISVCPVEALSIIT